MREITPENAAAYLRETGRVPAGKAVDVRALGWGVSNVVLRVEAEGEPPFVLKQAREKLRTKKLWVSRLERIWTERDAMALLGTILPEGVVPQVLFSDEENYLFAMTHAPADAVVWKEQLLAGVVDPAVARRAGEILGTIHHATRGHPALGGRLADTTVFDELRVDPFYREIARVHPEIAPQVDALIASMADPPDRCLVLGDFSPKNILVHDNGLTLVDFETAHAGDPAFDLGFCLSHLWLKGVRAGAAEGREPGDVSPDFRRGTGSALMEGYLRTTRPTPTSLDDPPTGDPATDDLWQRIGRHGNACSLARVDGKSPVDYLDEPLRDAVRSRALAALRGDPGGTGNAS